MIGNYIACIKFTPILITLQLNNIATLCNSLIETAKTHDLSLLSDAKAISEKFHIALTLFSKCHKLYDEIKTFSETNIRELGHLIHFCHTLQLRIYCLNPASNVSKGNIYSKASYVRESYSALDQDIKDWLWSDGRTGSRVSTCAIQLNGKGLQQYERPGRENESSGKPLKSGQATNPISYTTATRRKRQRAVEDDEEDTILP